MTNDTSKRCPRCEQVKPRSDFSPRNGYCRPCATARAKERYWRDAEWREERKQYHREHERTKRADPEKNAVTLARLRQKRLENAEWREKTTRAVNERRRRFLGRHLAITAKKRAKVADVPCTITPEWVQTLWETSPECVYCRRVLRSATSRHADDSATLDRIRPERGYTEQNTVLACFRCNNLKRDATIEELERLAENVRRVVDGAG